VKRTNYKVPHYLFFSCTIIPYFLGPNILFSTLVSNTFSQFCSLSLRDQVSWLHKTKGEITVLYIFSKQETRRQAILNSSSIVHKGTHSFDTLLHIGAQIFKCKNTHTWQIGPSQNQFNLIHSSISHHIEIHFNIILQSLSHFSKCILRRNQSKIY
jgi:hypothetical protein